MDPRVRWGVVLVWLACPMGALAEPSDRLLDEAIAKYDQGEFEASLQALDRAESATRDPQLLGRIYLYRGVNLAILHREGDARQAFVTALGHDAWLELDPQRFKPSIVELFREAQGKGGAQRRSKAPGPTSAPSSARPAARPFAVALAVGGAMGCTDAIGQLKLAQGIGYHFSGGLSGLALGLEVSEAFSSRATDAAGNTAGVTVVQVGPTLWWDLQLSSGLGLYLAPVLKLGLAYAHAAKIGWESSAKGLAVHAGAELKLLLGERALLFLRPVGLDLMVGSSTLGLICSESLAVPGTVVLRYDLLLGGGLVF